MKDKEYDLILIETFTWDYHLACTFEIALSNKNKGGKVMVFGIINNNLDEIPNTNIDIAKYQRKRFLNFKKLLEKFGVECEILDIAEIPITFTNRIDFKFGELMQSKNDIRDLEFEGLNFGRFIYSSMVTSKKKFSFELENYSDTVRNYFINSIHVYKLATTLLNSIKTSSVIIFNGRFAASSGIVFAAEAKKIKIHFHERGANFSKYQIFEERPHNVNYIRERIINFFQEDKNIFRKKKLADLFFSKRKNLQETGWISFGNNFTDDYQSISDDKKITIVYYHSSDFEFAAFEDLAPHTIYKSQKDALLQICEFIKNNPEYELIIRSHPNIHDANQEIEFLKELEHRNIKLILPDSKINSYHLMSDAQIIVGYGSTILVEAAYVGFPVISLYEGEFVINGYPILNIPSSPSELIDYLLNYKKLKVYPKENFIPWAFWMSHHGIEFKYFQPNNLFDGFVKKRKLGFLWDKKILSKELDK